MIERAALQLVRKRPEWSEIDVFAFPLSVITRDSSAPHGKNGPGQRQEYLLQVRNRIATRLRCNSVSTLSTEDAQKIRPLLFCRGSCG